MSRAPQPNWPDAPIERHRGPSVVPAMFAGAAIFAVGCGGGLFAGWGMGQASLFGLGGAGLFGGGFMGDAAVYIEADRPAELRVGVPFDLVITISDTRGEPRTLEDLDLSGPLCDLFTHNSVEPAPQIVNESYGYREHIFEKPIGANGSLQITFTLTPLQAGDFESTITAYMDEYDSEEYTLRLNVVE